MQHALTPKSPLAAHLLECIESKLVKSTTNDVGHIIETIQLPHMFVHIRVGIMNWFSLEFSEQVSGEMIAIPYRKTNEELDPEGSMFSFDQVAGLIASFGKSSRQ